MNGKAFRKKAPLIQRGLTLIEAAMVLAIATLVVAGIMMFFQSANMNARTNEAVGQLGAVQQAVRSVYAGQRSEEHTSELQSLMRISYAVFCLNKKTNNYMTIEQHSS